MTALRHSMDMSVMRRRLVTMEGNRARARDEATAMAAAGALKTVVGRAVGAGLRGGTPGAWGGVAYDTGRYARAYAMAHNQLLPWASAGVILPVALPELRPSDYLGMIRRRTEKQLERLELAEDRWFRLKESDERRPNHRRWKSYRAKLKILDRIEKSMERALEQWKAAREAAGAGVSAEDGAAAIFIAGRKTKTRFRLSNVGRVIRRIFGGEARLIRAGTMSVVEIRNMEPHARIVERRTRLMSRALAEARRDTPGLRRVSNRHLALLTVNAQGRTVRAGAGGGRAA